MSLTEGQRCAVGGRDAPAIPWQHVYTDVRSGTVDHAMVRTVSPWGACELGRRGDTRPKVIFCCLPVSSCSSPWLSVRKRQSRSCHVLVTR